MTSSCWEIFFCSPIPCLSSLNLVFHRITTWCSWQSFFGGLRWSSRHSWNQDCWTPKTQASHKFRPHDSIHGSNKNCIVRSRKWKWLCLLWKHIWSYVSIVSPQILHPCWRICQSSPFPRQPREASWKDPQVPKDQGMLAQIMVFSVKCGVWYILDRSPFKCALESNFTAS